MQHCSVGDPFAVTAVLSRQLSVTRKEWLKYTANQEDPDAPLYTQGTLAKALETPGNSHLVTNTSFLTTLSAPDSPSLFNFAATFSNRCSAVPVHSSQQLMSNKLLYNACMQAQVYLWSASATPHKQGITFGVSSCSKHALL